MAACLVAFCVGCGNDPTAGEPICTAQPSLVLNATVDGTLADGDARFNGAFVDYYAVQLSDAAQLTVRMASTTVNPLILVFDDQGNVIAQAFNATALDPGTTAEPSLTRVFDAGCTLVGATSFDNGATGGYSLMTEPAP